MSSLSVRHSASQLVNWLIHWLRNHHNSDKESVLISMSQSLFYLVILSISQVSQPVTHSVIASDKPLFHMPANILITPLINFSLTHHHTNSSSYPCTHILHYLVAHYVSPLVRKSFTGKPSEWCKPCLTGPSPPSPHYDLRPYLKAPTFGCTDSQDSKGRIMPSLCSWKGSKW